MKQSEKFKVKIVSCGLKDYWYSGNIGEVFEVIDFPEISEVSYCVLDTSLGKWIDKADCVILDSEEVNEQSKEEPKKNIDRN